MMQSHAQVLPLRDLRAAVTSLGGLDSRRQHNLLLARQVEHNASATLDAGAGACQLTSSTSTR